MSTEGASRAPGPGWYPEPGTGRQRWWTGSAWGDYAPPVATPPPEAYVFPTNGTNGFAIAGFILGILWGYGVLTILAIIFSLIGIKQARERNQGGRGLAIAGLVLGIVGVVGALILILLLVVAGHSSSTTSTTITY
jgi:hypothetical protein